MARENFTSKTLIVLPIILLLLPTTFFYIFGLPILLALSSSSIWIFLPTALGGYGLYAAWVLALKYKSYYTSKIPKHIIIGICSGAFLSILLFLFMGFPHDYKTYKKPWMNIFTIYLCGGGPMLLSSILLTNIIFKKAAAQEQ